MNSVSKNRLLSEPYSMERDIQALVEKKFSRVQPAAQRNQPNYPRIDPRKWHLDENTGEYLRIKHREGGRLLVDTTPFGERWKEKVLAENALAKDAALMFGFFFGGIVLSAMADVGQGFEVIVCGAGAFVCIVTSFQFIPMLIVDFFKEAFRDIGPEPVSQRPRREQAERQRVHGAGRFMNREEIHRAASGETAFSAEEQQYED